MNTIHYFITGGVAAGLLLLAWHRWIATVIVREHTAALLFRHGKFLRRLEPGRHRLFGSGHEAKVYGLRWNDMILQGQEFLTADKAAVKVSGVVRYRIADPLRFDESAENPLNALYVSTQLALRETIGALAMEAVLDRSTPLGEELTRAVRPVAAKLGVEIDTVAVKDLMIAGDLRRAFSEAITARQESLVTLEKARAEAAAMRTLANGARVFETHPALLQLKFLQTLEKADGNIAQPLALGTAGQWLDFLRK